MGWDFTHRAKGITNDEWFKAQVIGDGRTIVASSTIKNVYYAAVREDATGEVWALVCLTQRAPRSHYNYGWKSMTDTMGPGVDDAPAKVLDALTETDNEYANEWRARCRANLALKARTAKLAIGTTIRFAKPFTFSDGVERQEFTIIERRKLRARDGVRVNIPGWQQADFEVVSA